MRGFVSAWRPGDVNCKSDTAETATGKGRNPGSLESANYPKDTFPNGKSRETCKYTEWETKNVSMKCYDAIKLFLWLMMSEMIARNDLFTFGICLQRWKWGKELVLSGTVYCDLRYYFILLPHWISANMYQVDLNVVWFHRPHHILICVPRSVHKAIQTLSPIGE